MEGPNGGDILNQKAKVSCGVAMDLDLPGVKETLSVRAVGASNDDVIWQLLVFASGGGFQVL